MELLVNVLGLVLPEAWGAGHLLLPFIDLGIAWSWVEIEKQKAFILAIVLLMRHLRDSRQSISLNFLQYLIVSLSRWLFSFLEPDSVQYPLLLKPFNHLNVKLGRYGCVNQWIMEKGNLPIILLETLGELFKVGLDQTTDIRWRDQRLWAIWVLLD